MLRFGEYTKKEQQEQHEVENQKRLQDVVFETAPSGWECFEDNQNAVDDYVKFITRHSEH